MLWFTMLWVVLVYAPIAHWVWGDGGWLGGKGILDFAGGTVVHINAGVAGLVAAIIVGKRKGFPRTAMPPHNLMFTLMGAAMLWVGWFGFNAGSELAADVTAGMAMAVTQIATAMAAVTWMLAEWISHGKPSALGIASGAVAGLVAITPASGYAGPMGALAIGAAAGLTCFVFVAKIKPSLGLDDSLDAFGVHGIGGIVGALLTGVFCAPSLGGAGFGDGIESIAGQVAVQAFGVGATFIYTAVMSAVILLVLKVTIGLRVDEEGEMEGLDLSQHDERAYIL
jgi:Amt family ammonium transporter